MLKHDLIRWSGRHRSGGWWGMFVGAWLVSPCLAAHDDYDESTPAAEVAALIADVDDGILAREEILVVPRPMPGPVIRVLRNNVNFVPINDNGLAIQPMVTIDPVAARKRNGRHVGVQGLHRLGFDVNVWAEQEVVVGIDVAPAIVPNVRGKMDVIDVPAAPNFVPVPGVVPPATITTEAIEVVPTWEVPQQQIPVSELTADPDGVFDRVLLGALTALPSEVPKLTDEELQRLRLAARGDVARLNDSLADIQADHRANFAVASDRLFAADSLFGKMLYRLRKIRPAEAIEWRTGRRFGRALMR